MTIMIDRERANATANLLYKSFLTTGIHGRKDMPEDIVSDGIEKESLEHILFITLTVSLDYQRDAGELWKNSRKTFSDPDTRYLYNLQELRNKSLSVIIQDMQKYKLSKKPRQDAKIWNTVGISFLKKWQADPRYFLESCDCSASLALERLKKDTHLYHNRNTWDFPFLRGDKIGPLWLRMLRDNAGISSIKNMDQVPIPVDIHVARATLALGVVHGKYVGNLNDLFDSIRKAWFQGVTELQVENRPMIALDVDEPLWHLSKYGCTKRDKQTGNCPSKQTCELHDYCIPGKIDITNGMVELDT